MADFWEGGEREGRRGEGEGSKREKGVRGIIGGDKKSNVTLLRQYCRIIMSIKYYYYYYYYYYYCIGTSDYYVINLILNVPVMYNYIFCS